MKITPEILSSIAPTINGERAVKIAAGLDIICPKYGIDNADKFHEFIARKAWIILQQPYLKNSAGNGSQPLIAIIMAVQKAILLTR